MQVERSSNVPNQAPAPLSVHHLSWKMRIVLFLLALFVAGVVFVAAMIAKTGLVQVPLISGFVDSVGVPTRTVVLPAATPTVQETFRTQFEGAIARYARSRSEADRVVQFRLAEASLTKSLLAEIPNLKQQFDGAEVQSAQLAIDADALELFVKLKREGRENTLRVRFTIMIRDGMPSINIREARIGTVRVPSFATSLVTTAIGEEGMAELVQGLASVMRLEDVELRPGLMIVHGTLATGAANGR